MLFRSQSELALQRRIVPFKYIEPCPFNSVDHCTPSPLTTFGQKGSGEAGYLGAPAAVANAINDALAPLDASIETLPIAPDSLWHAITTARS